MFAGLETGAGLDLVLWFQANRLPPLDLLAVALHIAGGDLFFLGLLPLIYWCLDRELGMRLLFALVFFGLFNTALKLLFGTPRPADVSDLVIPLVAQGGFGFPSGHVMLAVGIWGTLAHALRRRWVTILVVIGVVLMMWARVYTGVHFPQDVVGGLIFGLLGLVVYIRLADSLPWLWRRLPLRAQVSAVFLAGLVPFVFLFDDTTGVTLTGVLLGAGAGVILEGQRVRFAVPSELTRQVMTYAFGIIVILLLFLGLRPIFDALAVDGTAGASFMHMLRYGLIALAAFALWPWLAVRLGLIGQRPPIEDEQIEGGFPA